LRSLVVGLMAALFATACGAPPPRPSVLIITVDTLRADFLGAYGDPDTRSPKIDALARAGTVFENAATPMPLTLPSHFSLMTSRYPREHGVLNNRMQLPDSAVTLAELFRKNGYATGAFVSVVLLDEESGAAQGFEAYGHPTRPRERPAAHTIAEALDWVSGLEPGEPFFLWVHLFEPHLPYELHEGADEGLDPSMVSRYPSLNWKQFYEVARENRGDIPSHVLRYAKSLYRGEVEAVDAAVGTLLDGLAKRGRRDDLVTVLTADHGEPFENGVYFEHGDSLYDGAIRVPLIVQHPTLFPSGERVDRQVSLIDVAPSLLRAAGIAVPAGYSGRALQAGSPGGDRYVLIQHPFYQPDPQRERPSQRGVIESVEGKPVERVVPEVERVGLVGQEWKLIRTAGSSEQLYRRAPSLGEDQLVVEDAVGAGAKLAVELNRQLESRPLELAEPERINPDLLENLEALGYME